MTNCENIDGQCAASWCDCDYQLRKRVKFSAGDIVKHGPSGEEWLVACDEENGEVMPCGWPMCVAKSSDCTLLKSASAKERDDMLKEWSGKWGVESDHDWRVITALRQLRNLLLTPPTPQPTTPQ